MRNRFLTIVVLVISVLFGTLAQAKNYVVEPLVPLPDAVKVTRLTPYAPTSKYRAAQIAWAGDIATELGAREGIYKQEGIDVEFYLDNDLVRQCTDMANGKLHFMRLTIDQAVQAAPLFERLGTDLVLVVQLTYSTGGDMIVLRGSVKLKDLKRFAMMLYGPHNYFGPKVLADIGTDPSKLDIVWVRDIMDFGPDKDGLFHSGYQAMLGDPTIQGATMIGPEAATATGTEGITGARIGTTTKESPYIIADVYVARGDFYDANRDVCYKFFRATLKSEEALKDLIANQAAEKPRFDALMKASATKIFEIDDAQVAKDALGDCRWVQHEGNRQFFTGVGSDGKSTSRNAKRLTDEILPMFVKLGLNVKRSGTGFPIRVADWDFNKAAEGLKYANVVERNVFDKAKTEAALEKMANSELGSLSDLVSLGTREVNFPANVTDLDYNDPKYQVEYKAVLELAQTHQGTPIWIVGHADPSMIQYLKKAGQTDKQKLLALEQDQKNKSTERARGFLAACFAYADANKIAYEKSQFYASGVGGAEPKADQAAILKLIEQAVASKSEATFKQAVDKAAPNRRVEFRVQQVDSELSSLKSLTGGN